MEWNQWVTLAYMNVSFRLNCGRSVRGGGRRKLIERERKGMYCPLHGVSRNDLSLDNN